MRNKKTPAPCLWKAPASTQKTRGPPASGGEPAPWLDSRHPPPCARGPGAFAPTAGQGLWVLVFAGACQGTAWAGLCLIHHLHHHHPRLSISGSGCSPRTERRRSSAAPGKRKPSQPQQPPPPSQAQRGRFATSPHPRAERAPRRYPAAKGRSARAEGPRPLPSQASPSAVASTVITPAAAVAGAARSVRHTLRPSAHLVVGRRPKAAPREPKARDLSPPICATG